MTHTLALSENHSPHQHPAVVQQRQGRVEFRPDADLANVVQHALYRQMSNATQINSQHDYRKSEKNSDLDMKKIDENVFEFKYVKKTNKIQSSLSCHSSVTHWCGAYLCLMVLIRQRAYTQSYTDGRPHLFHSL